MLPTTTYERKTTKQIEDISMEHHHHDKTTNKVITEKSKDRKKHKVLKILDSRSVEDSDKNLELGNQEIETKQKKDESQPDSKYNEYAKQLVGWPDQPKTRLDDGNSSEQKKPQKYLPKTDYTSEESSNQLRTTYREKTNKNLNNINNETNISLEQENDKYEKELADKLDSVEMQYRNKHKHNELDQEFWDNIDRVKSPKKHKHKHDRESDEHSVGDHKIKSLGKHKQKNKSKTNIEFEKSSKGNVHTSVRHDHRYKKSAEEFKENTDSSYETRYKHKQKVNKYEKDLKDNSDEDKIKTHSKPKQKHKKTEEKISHETKQHKIKKHVSHKHKNYKTDDENDQDNIHTSDRHVQKHMKSVEDLRDKTDSSNEARNKYKQGVNKNKEDFENNIHENKIPTHSRHKHKHKKPEENSKHETKQQNIQTHFSHEHKHYKTDDENNNEIDNIKTASPTKHRQQKLTTTKVDANQIYKHVDYTQDIQKRKNITRLGHNKVGKNVQSTKYYDMPFTPHKIKNDASINGFTKQILLRTLRLLDEVSKNSTEYEWKVKIKRLASNYETKFKEFLTASSQQNIKTRLGIQKVVLNAIDMSKQIANRLFNIMVSEIDKKGMLRSSRTQDIFHSELQKEVDSELNHACVKLGICSGQNGFVQLIIDVLTKILNLNDIRFKEAFDSLTDIVQFTDLSHTLSKANDIRLKKKIKLIEQEDLKTQRAILIIMKNTLLNRNKPLVLYSDSNHKRSNVNGTLAFLEICDLLDKKVPVDDANMLEWTQIRNKMLKWSKGDSIQPTIAKFIAYIAKTIDALDGKSYNAVLKNFGKML